MQTPMQGALLRIFIGEPDRWQGKALHLALVEEARRQGLAGATVLHGIEGFGAHSRIYTSRLVELSADLPVIVEIVDTEPAIQAFLPTVEAMVREGLMTWERSTVIVYRGGERRVPSCGMGSGPIQAPRQP
jgi:PII-like signaling protein